MSRLADSLKRLYSSGKITYEKIFDFVEKCVITPDQFKEITGKDYAV